MRPRAIRRLFAEALERRILLTTVTGTDPPANSHQAAVSTDVSATFDQDVVVGSATAENFVVHGTASQGQLVGAATAVSAAGPVITHNPTNDFAAGEVVHVTATSGISTTGGAANRRVWQFRTASTGSGQFADGGTAFGTTYAEHVAFGDADADGDLDVVFSGKELWLNDGAGGFTNSGQNLGTDLGEAGSEFADVDGDGDLDLVSGSRVSLNDGSGVFTNTGQDLGGGTATAGDLDGDGDLDIMTGVAYAPNRLFFNNGSGQFTDSGQSLGGGSTDGNSFGDFDNDGDLDAFERLNGSPNKVWINNGSGVFSDSAQLLGGDRPTKDANVGDLDGDGDLDVITGNSYGNSGRVFLNNGSGVFFDSGQVIADVNSPFIYGSKLADMDGDGDLDFVSLDRLTPHQIWLNDGSGTFSDSGERLTAPRASWGANVGDIDGDGDMDIVEINRSPVGGRIWINQNLEPNVALSVDTTSITENPGTATVTATLSAVHTQPVTIDLGFTGSATQTDDYTVTGSQISIPIGATTGSISITAVQDAIDDDDELIVVDITGAAGAQPTGTQQVTITIVDDDDPPTVDLSVNTANISENGGIATATATLSAASGQDVTVNLAAGGTATAGTDYNLSATQITITAGATTGTATVTAVDDAVDEPNETVDLTITATGATVGVAAQTVTIDDDDDPVTVALSVDTASIPEAAGLATFTATASRAVPAPVVIDLAASGTATPTADYTLSGTQVSIDTGQTSGSVTVTAVQDTDSDPGETVTLEITAVTGAAEDGEQSQTVTIDDDDLPPTFLATSLEATSTGFVAEFNADLDTSVLSQGDTSDGAFGADDLVVTGATNGPVTGSFVFNDPLRTLTFIATGGPLAADTYTVAMRSADNGFRDTAGNLLDGDANGVAGGDFSGTFTIAPAADGTVTLAVDDFVRGPGQPINLPADTTDGIPISITIPEGVAVRAVDFRVGFTEGLLDVTAATAGAALPGGALVTLNNFLDGLAIVSISTTQNLPTGTNTLVNLAAAVPEANASENYRKAYVVDIHETTVGDGQDNEHPVVDDDGLHVVAFAGDATGNGRNNFADPTAIARLATSLDSTLPAYPTIDFGVIADASGNGATNLFDATLVAQFAASIPVPQIPPIPPGVVITASAGGGGAALTAPGGWIGELGGNGRSDSRAGDLLDGLDPRTADSGTRRESESLLYPAVDRAIAEFEDPAIGEAEDEQLSVELEEAIDELFSSV